MYQKFGLLVAQRTFEVTINQYAHGLIERELGHYHVAGLSEQDKLTGCNTLNQFEADLTHMLRFKSYAEPVSLHFLCFDIGGLKNHNDTHGLHSGDLVIQKVAEALREAYPGEAVY